MVRTYIIRVRRSIRELGLVEGMSIEVPIRCGMTPRYGEGFELVRRMFMNKYGIDINAKYAWAPIWPGCFDIEEVR